MKKFSLLISIFVVLLLSGCGFRDIDKRFFVVAIGIDPSENAQKPYRVTLKLGIPSAEVEAGKMNYQMITEESDSIPEAIRTLQSRVDKEFDFGHCRIILLDEALVKKNHQDILNWFMRRRDLQGIAYMGVGKPSAKQVLQIYTKYERLAGNALVLAFDEKTNTSPYIIPEILNDYYIRNKEVGIDPYLPVIKPSNDTYDINTVALFKDQVLKGYLTSQETRVLNELMNKSRKGQINVKTGEEKFFINVDDFKSKLEVITPKNKKPYLHATLKIKGILESSNRRTNKNTELMYYQKEASKVLSKRVEKLLRHLIKMEVDPLGLELEYQAKHGVSKKVENQWSTIYRDLDIRITTDLDLKGTGSLY